MKIEKGKYYFLKVKLFGREIDYRCKVIDISKDRIKIVDYDGERLNFDSSNLMHYEEIDKSEVERVVKPVKIKKSF